jgi:hypothetical protein
MALGQALAFGATKIRVRRGSSGGLTQIPKLGNRPRPVVVLVLRFIGFCAEKRADLPGNYFVPFV